MENFLQALVSKAKSDKLPEKLNYFGKLIGGWKINYVNNHSSRSYKGEWHFSWILEGMAIQDVIILPEYEYGTTVRVYNPDTLAWDIAYCYTGKIMRLEARKQDGKIVLSHIDNEERKWVFVKIDDNQFHWQDVTVKDNGEWQIDFDIFAERI